MAVWRSLWLFGILFPFWYVWTKKNLATLKYTLAGIPVKTICFSFL
jgi:hypothetical protein